MKTFSLTRTLMGSVVVFLCLSSMVWSETESKGKRGEAPQCQNECLREHSEKMTTLESGLSKTGNRFAYQDQVEQEENRYARCLVNCREVVPIK